MKYLAAVAILLFAPCTWAVNKCTDAANNVTYQNGPCEHAGGEIKLHTPAPANKPGYSAAVAELQKTNAEFLRLRDEFATACGAKLDQMPYVGMPESDFRCSRLGIYHVRSVNQTTTANGVGKQFVLRPHSTSVRYVYTANGVVTAVQN